MIRWFKALSIRSKILMLVILGVIGVAGMSGLAKYSGVKKNTYMTVLQQSQTVETVMLQIMMAEEKFINTLDSQELSSLGDYRHRLEEALTRIKSYDVGAEIINEAALMSKTEAEHARVFQLVAQGLDEMSKAKVDLFKKIESVNVQMKKIVDALDKEELRLFPQGEYLSFDKSGLRKEAGDLLVALSDRLLNIQDLLLYGNVSKYHEARQAIEKRQEMKQKNVGLSVDDLKDFLPAWQASLPLLNEITTVEDTILDLWGKNIELKKRLQQTLAQIQHKSKSIAESSKATIESSNRSADLISLAISLCAIVILGGLGSLISGSINRSLLKSIAGLIEGADNVAVASSQVSTASQQLAEGASHQASSIEETSASLEKISSMTKHNAANATEANQLMIEARNVVGKANQSMLQVIESMRRITNANLETQKIIKTIDEIAFQTNLLALNAAVEAARAGESGAGFAVVADEVRNLAMRAAEAAKNTAELIEGTVETVKKGATLVETTNSEFSSVSGAVSKSGELIGEIAAASNEQARGIALVSKAVEQLDKVVQNNAANAEESAGASELMNTQAEQVKAYVNELKSLVGGSKESARDSGRPSIIARFQNRGAQKAGRDSEPAAGIAAASPQPGTGQPGRPTDSPAFSAREKTVGGVHFQKGNGGSRHQTKTVVKSPQETIPFDEGDF